MPSSAVGSFLSAAVAAGSMLALVRAAAESEPLSPRHARWIEEEVHFLVSSGERARFVALASEEERDRFVEQFWVRRDPTPGTPENEARDAHYRRLEESDRRFGSGAFRGRFTERGRTLQLLGAPTYRESFLAAGDRLVPLELWHYTDVTLPFLPDSFYLVFFRPLGDGHYRLWDPAADGMNALLPAAEPGRLALDSALPEIENVDPELRLAVEGLLEGSESSSGGLLATLAALPDLLERSRGEAEATARAGASFESLPIRIEAMVLEDDALVPEIHYALELPRGEMGKLHFRSAPDGGGGRRTRFTVSGRLVGDEGELDRWEDALEIEDLGGEPGALSFQGRRLLPPGARRLELALVNEGRASGFGSVEPHRLILARSLSEVAPPPSGLPFSAGGELLSPLAGDVVTHPALAVLELGDRTGEVLWQLEGAESPGEPRREGELLWSAHGPIEGSLMAKKLPLEGLPAGEYRLRVSDPGGVEERTFRWLPAREAPDPVRVLARERTPAEEASYRRRRASSFSRRGDRDRAIEEMKVAVSKAPGDAGLQLELAALRYSARRYSEVVEQLEPLQIELRNEPDLFVLLAASSEALGRFDRAFELYERALALAPDDRRLKESVARTRARRP